MSFHTNLLVNVCWALESVLHLTIALRNVQLILVNLHRAPPNAKISKIFKFHSAC